MNRCMVANVRVEHAWAEMPRLVKFACQGCKYLLVSTLNLTLYRNLWASLYAIYLIISSIQGGWFDDFLSHVMCCCCALVQEWREVEIRGIHDMHLIQDLILIRRHCCSYKTSHHSRTKKIGLVF
jgi:hypothetical protein